MPPVRYGGIVPAAAHPCGALCCDRMNVAELAQPVGHVLNQLDKHLAVDWMLCGSVISPLPTRLAHLAVQLLVDQRDLARTSDGV